MSTVYMMGQLIGRLFNKEVDYENDTIKLMLLTSSATPNIDIHVYIQDLSGNEITGDNYTAGGIELTGKSLTFDSTNNKVVLDADNILWTNGNFTTRYGVIYSVESSVIIGYIDFEEELNLNNQNLGINLSDSGFFILSTKRYILDELENYSNCVLGFSYKRLSYRFRDEMVYVQRTSDYEKRWFGYDKNGDLESSAIETWVGAGNDGLVEQYMNQLNTSYPAYQTTLNAKPKIVENGNFLSDGLKFDDINDYLKVSYYNDLNVQKPFTLYSNYMTTAVNSFVFGQLSSASYATCNYAIMNAGTLRSFAGKNINYIASTTRDLNAVNKCIFSYESNNNYYLQNNNYSLVTGNETRTMSSSNDNIYIGVLYNDLYFSGYIKSILIFNSNEYSNYTAIKNAGI